MKYLKHLICMVMMLFLLLPGAAASESKGEGVNLQEILWGHIKDSYEWHVAYHHQPASHCEDIKRLVHGLG